MGFDVHVVITLNSVPSDVLMGEFDHHFEVAVHAAGTKVVELVEHVTVAKEADAIAFVRSLVMDAIPAGAKITAISAEAC
jgi:hypothetical protein